MMIKEFNYRASIEIREIYYFFFFLCLILRIEQFMWKAFYADSVGKENISMNISGYISPSDFTIHAFHCNQ